MADALTKAKGIKKQTKVTLLQISGLEPILMSAYVIDQW